MRLLAGILMTVALFAGEPPTVRLGPITEAERSRPMKPGVMAVGVHRALPAGVMKKGKWQKGASGKKAWRLRIQAAEAKGIRLHFGSVNLGSNKMTLLGNGKAAYGPYTGKGPMGDGEFWAEIVEGDSVTIEYDGDSGKPVPFQLLEMSHLFKSILE